MTTLYNFQKLEAEKNAIIVQSQTTSLLSEPGLEALSIQRSIMSTITRFSNFLGEMSKRITFGLSDDKQKNMPHSHEDKALLRQLSTAMEKGNYIDLMELRVQVVPGLSTTWDNQLDSWEGPIGMAVNFYDLYLLPFQKFLAIAVNDPEKFTTVNTVMSAKDVDVAGYHAALTNPLSGNTKTNLRSYKDCTSRNLDTIDVFNRSIEYAASMNSSNLRLVKDAVNDVSRLLGILSQQIVDYNLGYRLNAKTISDLSDYTFQLAKITELYGVTYAYVSSQKEAMIQTAHKLVKVVR